MRQRVFASILLFTALFVIGTAGRAAAQVGRVNGVVKGEDGQPLKGATVTAENREHRAKPHRNHRRQGSIHHDRPARRHLEILRPGTGIYTGRG